MKRIIFLCMLNLVAAPVTLLAQVNPLEKNNDLKSYYIGGIEVKGAEYTDNNAIIGLSGLAVGDKLTIPGSQTTDAIQKLWKQNIFSDISISVDKYVKEYIFITINVKERGRISQFAFSGISKSQADDLREKINFIRGTILTESKVQSAKRIIRNHYVEKGYFDTQIDITTQPDPILKNGTQVNINVKKGKHIKINEIISEGNEAFADNKLERKLKETKEKRFWRLWKRSKYIPKEFESDKEKLIAAYNEAGYRDAKIEMDTVMRHDEKTIDIKLKIYEGKKYYFRDIKWVGNYKYNSEQLKAVLGVKKGDIYNQARLEKRLTGDPNGGDVSALYLDDGHLFYRTEPTETTIEGDSIDLEMRMFEGPQATIRKVSVEGNTKTSDYVILRELRTYPGDKFRRSDLIRSVREITALGYFDQEKVNCIPIPNAETGTVDLKYIVEEKPSDQLQLQGGWGGRPVDATGRAIGSGFQGTLMLTFNNFSTKRFLQREAWKPVPSGDGQKLSLAVQTSVGFQVYSASFMEPWLGGKKPNSLGVSTSYSIFTYGVYSNAPYKNKIFTTQVDYGKRLKFPDDFFTSFMSLVYKYYDIENPGQVFPVLGAAKQVFMNNFSLKYNLSRSSIDAPLYPRSGSSIALTVEATPPYSLFRKNVDYESMPLTSKFNLLEYHRWRFSSDWYFRIAGNLVLRTKIDAGFLGFYNKQVGLSPINRYYLGGSGMIGMFGGMFDGREVLALRGYKDLSISGTNSNGSTIFNKLSMELRYPITLNQSAPIWLLGFAEAGNGYPDFKSYNPFRLYRSAGVGARIMLPMVGLLGVDWGYGFDNFGTLQNGDASKGSNFHFILGQQF
ncbi:MAG: outer membrane protein assembly factor BamA [Bacteroidia bacterium]